MLPENIHTIHECIEYCRQVLNSHPQTEKDIAMLAGHLLNLSLSPGLPQWKRDYPQIIEILDTASDLDWLNTESPKGDWRKIERLVNELERAAVDNRQQG